MLNKFKDIYIGYGSYGRESGMAIIKAHNKEHAELILELGWLATFYPCSKFDGAYAVIENQDENFIPEFQKLIDETLTKTDLPVEYGAWVEIEWGL